MSRCWAYVVDGGVLELVLVFVVKDDAVLIEEAHDGRLPAGRTQEVDDDIEKPVLYTKSTSHVLKKRNHFRVGIKPLAAEETHTFSDSWRGC